MLLSKCAVCNCEKLKFINGQKARWLLSNLTGIKVPILSDLPIINTWFEKCKMNEMINKFLLTGD